MKILNKYYLVIFFITFASVSLSTTFYPLPLSKQLVDSTGVVKAVFKSQNTKKMNDGQIMTEGSFHLLEVAGLSSGEIVNSRDFRILYPGGVYNGLVYEVFGSPKFKNNEKVILILTKQKGVYTINNLSLGKYRVQEDKKETYYVSEVFPNHPKIGKIKDNHFDEIIFQQFGTKLLDLDPAGYVKADLTVKREIASKNESNKVSQKVEVYWLVFLLMGLGLVSILITNKD